MAFSLLLAQACATFAASFIVGYLPLILRSFTTRHEQQGDPEGGKVLRAVSVVGMGLLVGSALTIIIPEGVSTLLGSLPEEGRGDGGAGERATRWMGGALLAGFGLMMLVESLTPHGEHETDEEHHYDHLSTHSQPSSPGHHHHHHHHHLHHEEPEAFGTPFASVEGETAGETMVDAEQEARDSAKAFALKRQGTGLGSGVWMGREDEEAAGVPFGGANKVPPSTTGTSKDVPAHMRMNSRTALMRRRSSVQDRCQEAVGGASGRGVAGLNATLGLVIHAMADGIALGASSLSGSGGLGLIVFVAVIVHKGPTALGLTTTLLTLGLTKPQIRTRLLLFSASAPIGAVITYMIVKAVGGGQNKVPDTEVDLIGWWTGVVLLFSGGSFLYVATVISPLSDSDAHGTHQHAHQGKHDEADGQALGQKTRLGLLLAGMIGPWALSMLISHGH
ncbi:hypothetical protein NliqN6_5981 [Naganishia liquefaciens]|uniref:ZIP family metal transporter n=1 Tax=Naganishia liquefaciens TaxID=104408 RepID=A0A8H3TYR9_9TREE|nr:hypothetical protein NliqN6_5981 [Naganishia liquefaciens]